MAQFGEGRRHSFTTGSSYCLMQKRSIALRLLESVATGSKLVASLVQAAAYYRLNVATFTCPCSSIAAEL